MLNFNKITLHNFGSYSHTEIDLADRGFCLVTGKNDYAPDNAQSNGSGKSFIWSAICFALTGETINGLHSKLVNIHAVADGGKYVEAYVEVDLTIDGINYVIRRILSPKSDMKITRDGKDISGKGIKESEMILKSELPELTKDLIASTIIIGQGMPNKFSSFSPAGRKELLEKLTKSDFMIEDVKNRIAMRLDTLNNKVREFQDAILVTETNIDSEKRRLESAISELNKEVNTDFDNLILNSNKVISELEKNIEAVKTQLEASNKLNTEKNNTLLNLVQEKNSVSTEEMKSFTDAMMESKSAYNAEQQKILLVKQELNKIQNIKDVCPTCGQKIHGVHKPSEEEVGKLNDRLKAIDEKLKEMQAKQDELQLKHTNYTRQISEQYDESIMNTKAEITALDQRIRLDNAELNTLNTKLTAENTKLIKYTYEKENYYKHRQDLQAVKERAEATINTLTNSRSVHLLGLEDIQNHLAVLKKIETLTKRDFRGYILENIISYLDKRAKQYCKVVFGTEDLSLYASGNNLEISYCDRMFDNLSGGEKQRVDLILQLAIRDLLSNYFNITSNIIVLDEITDFLDRKSCSAVMSLLSQELETVDSVFVISHHAEELDLPVDSELHIIKNSEGISEVFYQI